MTTPEAGQTSEQRGASHVATGDLFGGLRALAKGDTVQRGDIFINDGQRFAMDNLGFLFGVRCLGQTIRKDNGGWYRPSPNAGDVARPAAKKTQSP